MNKSKAIRFVMSFIILFISISILNYVYARNNEVTDNWGVTITSDSKEINDTHKIKFKVEENKNVVKNKIAPGMKAIAEIEINLEKAEGFVDIDIKIDDSKLEDVFTLNATLDGKIITSERMTKIKTGEKKKVKLELIWNGNNFDDTQLGISTQTIEIPIQISVSQHI